MGTTNRAEEILKKHTNINRDWIDCSVVDILDAMEEYRQSEIDELTKELEALEQINTKLILEKLELTKEVERLLINYLSAKYS